MNNKSINLVADKLVKAFLKNNIIPAIPIGLNALVIIVPVSIFFNLKISF